MAGLDADTIRHALETARSHGFAEVELTANDGSFSAKLLPVARPKKSVTSADCEPVADPLLRIESGFVGYYRPIDGALTVGAEVKAGSVVAAIASLGIANDVESKVSGEVFEVCVEPNQAVEYGQLIALVRPQ